MSQFLTSLQVSHHSDGNWTLMEPLMYESNIAKEVFTVPSGFSTDFDSVPRLPLAYLLFSGVVIEPAVIHDYLYATGSTSRRLADAVFLEAMEVYGITTWRRCAMWLAVRMLGWLFFRKRNLQAM